MTAGTAANVIEIVDCCHLPAIWERTSRSASPLASPAKRSVSSGERPMLRPSSTPLTDSDSCTCEVIRASRRCRSVVIRRRIAPTRRLIHTVPGSSTKLSSASRTSIASMATPLATTTVAFDTIDVAVLVTMACMPPMSFAMRDCTSPVRVFVKNASDMR